MKTIKVVAPEGFKFEECNGNEIELSLVPVKPKIEVGKWYKLDDTYLLFVEQVNNQRDFPHKAYGFNNRCWQDSDWENLTGYKEASHEYVEQRLIKEAKDRFGCHDTIYKYEWDGNCLFYIDESKHSTILFTKGKWLEILPPEKKYPTSVDEIEGRIYWMTHDCEICEETDKSDKPRRRRNSSTPERLKAFLALMQLVELRDAWNKVDGFVVDWIDSKKPKHCIGMGSINSGYFEIEKPTLFSTHKVLHFGFEDTRDKFLEQFKSLIEDAKELL